MLTRLLLGLMWSKQWDSALPDVLHTYLQLPNRQWKWNLFEYLQSVARQGSLGGGGERRKIRLTLGPRREGRRHRLGTGLLFLELQKTRFDLRLGVLQGGGGQSGVGHGGRHLRDAASQLLPAQQGGRRGAVAPGSGQVRHVHGGVVSRRDRGSGLQGGSLAGLFGLTELSVRLHFQGGSEVEADG